MKRIVIISNQYPTYDRPEYAFIEKLAASLADAGAEISVISPVFHLKRRLNRASIPPRSAKFTTPKGSSFSVYRPGFVSASDSILGVNTARISLWSFTRAVYREILRLGLKPDALYGHFISMSGLCAASIGNRLGVPAFLGFGESSDRQFQIFSQDFLRNHLSMMAGAIAVSRENMRRLEALRFLPRERIRAFPNAVDPAVFYPMNRQAARQKLGLPKDAFVVAFVGSFIERKGVGALEEALDRIPDAFGLFVGDGPLRPTTPKALFVGRVPNAEVYQYLSAADVFALPTRDEGCSNAVIEAMACGLPVISSDLPFNDDILSGQNSIRIDTADVSALEKALTRLKDDPALRERLGAGGLSAAQNFTVHVRAARILSFMSEVTNESKGQEVF